MVVDSNLYISFIQFTAHAQDSFVIQVMPSSTTSLTRQYRLYVTGSSAYLITVVRAVGIGYCEYPVCQSAQQPTQSYRWHEHNGG